MYACIWVKSVPPNKVILDNIICGKVYPDYKNFVVLKDHGRKLFIKKEYVFKYWYMDYLEV